MCSWAKPTKTEEVKKVEVFESIRNYAFLDDEGKVAEVDHLM